MDLVNSLLGEAWFIAYRYSDVPLFCDKKNNDNFFIIKNSIRYWCADPFLFKHGNTTYIFMEIYDNFKQKGCIGYRTIKNGCVSKIHKCLETEHHLSYPYIFEKQGEIYMLPESYQSNNLVLYRAIEFPDIWESCDVFLENISVCDTDYIYNKGQWYLLTTPVDDEKFVYDRLDLYYQKDDVWVPCLDNPVVLDAGRARNAGMPFEYQNCIFRPSQNCSRIYGENLIFNQIDSLSYEKYEEHEIAKVTISDIPFMHSFHHFDGVHTYNMMDGIEVVDLYCSRVFLPMRFIRLCINRLGRGNKNS